MIVPETWAKEGFIPSFPGTVVKRETGWHTQLVSPGRKKAAKLLRWFSRAECDRCESPQIFIQGDVEQQKAC